MKQKIDDITANEEVWVASQLEGAEKFVDAFSPEDAGQPITLAALDRAFANFLATNESDTGLINAAINCVGIAFGQFLNDGLGLKWVIAADEQGSNLAVYGLPGKGDVLVYPANFVAKRWENKTTHFLETSYQQISELISAVAEAQSTESQARPWWKLW